MTSPSIKQYMEIDMIFSLIADICTQQLDTEEHVKIWAHIHRTWQNVK